MEATMLILQTALFIFLILGVMNEIKIEQKK